VKILEAINFNRDTIRIGVGPGTHEIEIETDHGPVTESRVITVDRSEGIIITKVRGVILLGVQDDDGN
jgi:hypothetical protein